MLSLSLSLSGYVVMVGVESTHLWPWHGGMSGKKVDDDTKISPITAKVSNVITALFPFIRLWPINIYIDLFHFVQLR